MSCNFVYSDLVTYSKAAKMNKDNSKLQIWTASVYVQCNNHLGLRTAKFCFIAKKNCRLQMKIVLKTFKLENLNFTHGIIYNNKVNTSMMCLWFPGWWSLGHFVATGTYKSNFEVPVWPKLHTLGLRPISRQCQSLFQSPDSSYIKLLYSISLRHIS